MTQADEVSALILAPQGRDGMVAAAILGEVGIKGAICPPRGAMRLLMALPNRSIAMITPITDPLGPRRASGVRLMTGSRHAGPNESIGAPVARFAATGAKTSRP